MDIINYWELRITPRSSKDKVITSACELVDQQETEIKDLQDKQTALFYLLGGLTLITLIF